MTLIPEHTELTEAQTAELLNVSVEFLNQLFESAQLHCREVESERRVLFRDVMAYKQQVDHNRLEVLSELSKQAQVLKMGY